MNAVDPALPAADWDDKLQKLGGHFLQSHDWMQFQSVLKREVCFDSGKNWSWSASVRHARGGWRYVMVPYGPTVTSATALVEAVASVRQVGKKLGVDFIRMEPTGPIDEAALIALGAKSCDEVDPGVTHILDLNTSIEELKSGLESGHRNRVNGAERRGISVTSALPEQIDDFLTMMHDTAHYNKIHTFDNKYFKALYNTLQPGGAATLYYATVGSERIASSIVFDWGDTRYYAYAAANQAKNRQVGASVVLVWQTILDAKASGKKFYDFWGVAPEGASNHKWAGLSAFKRGFGGEDKTYLGSWDIPLHTVRYKLYRAATRVVR